MNGVSVKSCQSAAVKRGLPFTNEPATKQTKNTENSPVSTSVSPINTPIVSPAVTPSISPAVTPSISPAVSPSVSPAVTPIVSPAITPIVSPAITPVASPTPSRSSSVTMSSGSPKITEKVFKTANGVTFKIKDVVCIANSKTHCDYAEVKQVWKTKVDIHYLKKTSKGLTSWMLSANEHYKDSVHINSIFYSFGKTKYSQEHHQVIKEKLSKLF